TFAHLADYSSTKYLVDVINETQSPDFHFSQFVMFLMLVSGTVAAMPRATRAIAAADLLQVAFFAAATFSIQRMVVWSLLFLVLVLPGVLHHCWAAPTVGDAGLVAALRHSAVTVRRGGMAMAGVILGAMTLWEATALPTPSDRCEDVRAAIAAYAGQQRA